MSSTVGGARVSDPAADLAVALAVSSAAGNKPVPQRIVALGEVGLAGELRRVPGISRRLNEAARLGFVEAVIPAETRDSREQMMTVHAGLVVHSVSTLDQALAALRAPATGPNSDAASSLGHAVDTVGRGSGSGRNGAAGPAPA